MHLFNDADHIFIISFYIKWRQVETKWRVRRREGEREREKHINGARDITYKLFRNGVG
jgi:hypothetical protein